MSKLKYAASDLWSDVEPIPLHDSPGPASDPDPGPPALATIAYTARYAEAMSYLRAVMAAHEYSERALDLTEDIIGMNPAHYTVWIYRSRILRELGDTQGEGGYLERVKGELAWLDSGVCAKNLKNYQIWHHRQTLVSALPGPPLEEIPFITSILALDTKNYHVWNYRQWLCSYFPALLSDRKELRAVEAMIDEDVRNNSAWSHRYFLCFGAEDLKRRERARAGNAETAAVVDEEVVEREVEYAMRKIELAPQNASPWAYLKGVLKRGGRGLETVQGLCERFVRSENGDGEMDLMGEGVRSSHALDCLAEIYQLQGDGGKARQCLDALANKWDPIRANYWHYRQKTMAG